MDNLIFSVVVPMYNEQECVQPFYNEIKKVMDGMGENYELIFVNDGSKDKTLQLLYELSKTDKTVKILNLSRNFGQQAAILAGFSESKGKAVINLDCDLQDPPELIPEMANKWREGNEIVYAVRSARKKDTFFKRFSAKCYYKTVRKITGLNIPENVSEFRLLDRKVVSEILKMTESTKFLRAQCAFLGFRQASVYFERPERVAGKTKYNLRKLVKLAISSIIPNSKTILHIPMTMGIITTVLSLGGFIALIVLACLNIAFSPAFWVIPSAALLSGVTMLMMGFSNVYLGAVYDEVKKRPPFVINDKINFD